MIALIDTHTHIFHTLIPLLETLKKMKAIMKQMNKRRRVYSLETDETTSFTTFSLNYIAYLAQALMCINLSIGKNKDQKDPQDMKRKLRFEIDMAMVVSIGTHFKWAKTLKNKLESSQCMIPTTLKMNGKQPLILFFPCIYVPRTLSLNLEVKREMEKDAEVAREREEDEIVRCIFLLRELLPGGNEVFSMNELISEVESYVTCLQFKVQVLKSLVYST
ncbi:hypothetical protein LUZ60_002601 [Juncus effusus]|nr:hypothetical protein LUZ60_002601 [Juncus effusus]